MSDEICQICEEVVRFRLVTEEYLPIKTENNLYYIGGKYIISSFKKINPPIPTWTDLQGNSVSLYGAVLIGGNGLNS